MEDIETLTLVDTVNEFKKKVKQEQCQVLSCNYSFTARYQHHPYCLVACLTN